MEKFVRWLIFMTMLHCTLAGTVTQLDIYLLGQEMSFTDGLLDQGAQPTACAVNLTISGDTLSAEDRIVVSAQQAVFRVPAAGFSVPVATTTGSGKPCDLTFSTGTTSSLTFVLKNRAGSCQLPQNNKFSFILPQAVLATNPLSSSVSWTVNAAGSSKSYTMSYTARAITYVNVDPRNAADTDSFLIGGGTPASMRVTFTPTADLATRTQITVTSAQPHMMFRGVRTAVSFTIGATGCTGSVVTSFSTAAANSVSFNLEGSSCRLAANVPVQVVLPGSTLNTLPVGSSVSVSVTAKLSSGTDIVAGHLNPDVVSTTDGCGPWGQWAACSATCSGTTTRTRTSPGACAATAQSRQCNTIACGCTEWGQWSRCSATCDGRISRSRTGSSRCNVPTIETLPCGPTCDCPWTETNCSSSCGSGVRTRTLRSGAGSNCGPSSQQVVCNEPFTAEAQACQCQDLKAASGAIWRDRNGASCADYVNNGWCTSSGGYGPNWPSRFGSFAALSRDGETAMSACCGCGKSKCVKDVVLLIDMSGSIGTTNFVMVKKYIMDRVAQTEFTNEYGNRMAVVSFAARANIVCPLTWDKAFLTRCVAAITYTTGGTTATADGLNVTGWVLNNFSSPLRTRVVEMVTDGSPNQPTNENVAVPLAYNAAWYLKDQGITILTLGLGTACTPAKNTDCMNRTVLNTMASEPASSYAVLLESYESLAAMAMFISSQCEPTTTGFDEGALPSPSPPPNNQCLDQEKQIPRDYIMQSVACGSDGLTEVLQQYDCVELQPSCGTYQCEHHVPRDVISKFTGDCKA